MAQDFTTTIDNPPTFPATEVRSKLDRAVAKWEAGRRIPYDLAVDLIEEGYDLPALKAKHGGAA